MNIQNDIVVVGGGIGGAATTLALHKNGFKVRVYERVQEIRQVGAGLALWPNATHVLRELGLLKPACRVSQVLTNYRFYSSTGTLLVDVPLETGELPTLGMHRADLHRLLWEPIPAAQKFLNAELIDFETSPGRVRATFTNRPVVIARALIGADGLRSRVRQKLLGDGNPIYRGFTTWRGLLTDSNLALGSPKHICEFLGPGGGFGYLSLGQGRLYWYAAAVRRQEAAPDLVEIAQLLNLYRQYDPRVGRIIEATEPKDILQTNLYDHLVERFWSEGNVTLLGDAAHPMLPTLGQGACTALEDALTVTKCLSLHENPGVAFDHYQQARFARIKNIAEHSRRSAKLGSLTNPSLVRLRHRMMQLLAAPISRSLTRLHAYRA